MSSTSSDSSESTDSDDSSSSDESSGKKRSNNKNVPSTASPEGVSYMDRIHSAVATGYSTLAVVNRSAPVQQQRGRGRGTTVTQRTQSAEEKLAAEQAAKQAAEQAAMLEQQRQEQQVAEDLQRQARATKRAEEIRRARLAKERETLKKMQQEREERLRNRQQTVEANAIKKTFEAEQEQPNAKSRKEMLRKALEMFRPADAEDLFSRKRTRKNSQLPSADQEHAPCDTTVSPDVRAKVCQKLAEALGSSMEEATSLASAIETALFDQLGKSRDYFIQARSIVFNLKDHANSVFRSKILDGLLSPQELPKVAVEEMASDDRIAQRERARQEAFEASALKPDTQYVTDVFTCDKCKGSRTSYSQSVATESCIRSGGEPTMTSVTFITCLDCNHQWTERSGLAFD